MAKMFKPYPYQERVLGDIEQVFRDPSADGVMLVAPTGSGKTVLGSFYAGRRAFNQKRVWFVVQLDVLVQQTYESFVNILAGMGIPPNYIGVIHPAVKPLKPGKFKTGMVQDYSRPIQVVAQATAALRIQAGDIPARYAPHDVITDECHTSWFREYSRTIKGFARGERWIGCTGTPVRLDQHDTFKGDCNRVVFAPTVNELTYPTDGSAPRLCPLKVFEVCPDLQRVEKMLLTGNADEEAKVLFDTPESIKHAFELYSDPRYCDQGSMIGFCIDVAHAENCAKHFTKNGYLSEAISYKTKRGRPSDVYPQKRTRCAIVKAFKEGRIQCLFGRDVLSIGFDVPRVSVGLLLRPTQSSGVNDQQLGRVRRTHPGKEVGYIIDCVGNVARHGIGDREYTEEEILADPKERDENAENPFAVPCVGCYKPIHPKLKACPHCGVEQPERESSTIDALTVDFDGSLIERLQSQQLDPSSKVDAMRLYRNILKRVVRIDRSMPAAAYYRFLESKRFGHWASEIGFEASAWTIGAVYENPESTEAGIHYYTYLKGKLESKMLPEKKKEQTLWGAIEREFSPAVVAFVREQASSTAIKPMSAAQIHKGMKIPKPRKVKVAPW